MRSWHPTGMDHLWSLGWCLIATVVIRSEIGRMYKSNISRLRTLERKRRCPQKCTVWELKKSSVEVVQVIPRRGPGRPRNVVKPVLKCCSTQTPTKRGKPKKVSTGVGSMKRKVQVKTIPVPEKALPKTGLNKECEEGTRRSPRLLERAAIT